MEREGEEEPGRENRCAETQPGSRWSGCEGQVEKSPWTACCSPHQAQHLQWLQGCHLQRPGHWVRGNQKQKEYGGLEWGLNLNKTGEQKQRRVRAATSLLGMSPSWTPLSLLFPEHRRQGGTQAVLQCTPHPPGAWRESWEGGKTPALPVGGTAPC